MRTVNCLASAFLALVIAMGIVERVNSQAVDSTKALATLQEKILSKGPHGEEPSPADSLNLSAEELERIRGLKAKAAIVMHYMQSDWSQAQVAGHSYSVFTREQSENENWVRSPDPQVRLVHRNWKHWRGNLPTSAFPAILLDGELLRFALL